MTFNYYLTFLFLATVLYFSASRLDWDWPSDPIRHWVKSAVMWTSIRFIFWSTIFKILLVIAESLDAIPHG